MEAKPGNIFFHRMNGLNKCHIWILEVLSQGSEGDNNGVQESTTAWAAVSEGHLVIKADGSLHYVIVTERMQPSLVVESTFDKMYKQRISDAPLYC